MGETVDVERQLKDAIEAALGAGWSLYAIAKAAGVPHSALHGFMHSGRSLKLPNVNHLAGHFGMRFTTPKIRKPPADVQPKKGPRRK